MGKTAKLNERHFLTVQKVLLVHNSTFTAVIVKLFLKNRTYNINYDDDDDAVGQGSRLSNFIVIRGQ